MAWFDDDVSFDDGGLDAELQAAARLVDDLRHRRELLVRQACRDWTGGARQAFDRSDALVRADLAALADALGGARRALDIARDRARQENRRRERLRRERDECAATTPRPAGPRRSVGRPTAA